MSLIILCYSKILLVIDWLGLKNSCCGFEASYAFSFFVIYRIQTPSQYPMQHLVLHTHKLFTHELNMAELKRMAFSTGCCVTLIQV
jgi:hypothetical protein